jgi:pimeloyl-ACP methyl ester carboxylesterase
LKRSYFSLAAVLVFSLLLFACGGDDASSPAATPGPDGARATEGPPPTLAPPPALVWSRCGAFECATFPVPLDYDNPARGEIELALIRQAARDPASRIGVLFANPGGPGGSAIEFGRVWARILPGQLQDRFDIVAFDPRGVGDSSPLRCADNIQEIIGLEPEPSNDEDWQVIEETTREFAETCEQRGGDVLPYLGTVSVARDMDRIRQAMGEEQLTYFGYSYGTVIGQVYADLFPQRVRAMVLDSAVDLTLTAEDLSLEQTIGFEAALGRFIADCRARACLSIDPEVAVRELLRRSRLTPIPSPGADRPAGPGETLYAIAGSLYSRVQWGGLAVALQSALDGNGTDLIRLVDRFLSRNSDGSYDNLVDMNAAVNCLDHDNPRDISYFRQLQGRFHAAAPFFGKAFAQGGLVCALWAADSKPLQAPVAAGAPVILVIGNTGDPATPYKWSVAVSRQLESAVLLTFDAEGHTAYRMGSSCIDGAVNAYLLELIPPADGTTCGSAGIAPAPPVRP